MEILIWLVVFILAVIALIKGSDIFVLGAEKLGAIFGLSSFIIGVVIVGLGTSLPELSSAIVAAINGKTEIILANALGSNIFNILIIVGLASIISKSFIKINRSLIDLDLPLLAISSVLVFAIVIDGKVTFYEGIILLFGYLVYLAYSFNYKESSAEEKNDFKKLKISFKKSLYFIILGSILLIFGAEYAISSIVKLSKYLFLPTSTISAIALAGGTSLPELFVSIRAASKKKYEIAIGNIFGSNIFNGLVVIGLPAIFKDLIADYKIINLIAPMFLVITFLFVVSGISQRVHKWEGGMYVLLYIFLLGKLLNFF